MNNGGWNSETFDKIFEISKEEQKANQYRANFILKRTDKYTKETKVWCSPILDAFNTFDKAHDEIQLMRQRNDFDVISAWIDVFDEYNNKTTVFHDCYIDFIGNVER